MGSREDRCQAYGELAKSLAQKWEQLCARYLTVVPENSMWRFNRGAAQGDAEQGWKLHVSATVLTANDVLRRIGPLLQTRGVRFKAIASLPELQKLNSGLSYRYSQVGKFLTVYPRSTKETVSLALGIHRLTRRMSAPSVPFDLRFRPDSCVYYRYGSFKHLEMENPDGTKTLAMRDPEGKLVPDVRESAIAGPDWAIDPFAREDTGREACQSNSSLSTFRAFQALTQRGKGGVYKAVDLRAFPPRLCILKEGRAYGEVAWDKCDGRRRVKNEEQVLKSLRKLGVPVPCVYSSFKAEHNYYLVTEFIEGTTLHHLLTQRRRRLPVVRALAYSAEMAALVSEIHDAGWVWRDCKPANIMITKEGALRPLDFEGACRSDLPEPLPWSTRGFAPPVRSHRDKENSSIPGDVYALGAVLYLLLTGRTPEPVSPLPVAKLRPRVPRGVSDLLSAMLDVDPQRRPEVRSVKEKLRAVLNCGEWPPSDAYFSKKAAATRNRISKSGLTRRVNRGEVQAASQVSKPGVRT